MRINLAEEAADIASALSEFEKQEAASAKERVLVLQREVDNGEVRYERARNKLALHKDRRTKIDGAIAEITDSLLAKQLKRIIVVDKVEAYRRRAHDAHLACTQNKLLLSAEKDTANKITSLEHLASYAEVLKAICQHLDTSVPVVFDNGKLKWRTSDVHFKDGLGGWCDTAFGQFDVCVNLATYSGGIQEVYVWAQSCGDSSNRKDGYPHPHIEGGGKVCLGDAQTPLRDAMKSGDFVKAILLLTELFTTYNRNSPYIVFRRWEENIFDTPELKCGCGAGDPHKTSTCESSASCSGCLDRFNVEEGLIENISSELGPYPSETYLRLGKNGICTSCKAARLQFSPFWDANATKLTFSGLAGRHLTGYLLMGTGWHKPSVSRWLKEEELPQTIQIEEYAKYLNDRDKLQETQDDKSS